MMVVRCISQPIKKDITTFLDKRSKDMFNLTKLHHNLMKVDNVEWRVVCPKCGYNIPLDQKSCPYCETQIDKEKLGEYDHKKITKNRRMTKEEWNLSKIGLMGQVDELEDLKEEFRDKCPTCGKAETYDILFETIKCLPKEVKKDLSKYIRNRADNYTEEIKKEANVFADTLQNKVCNCVNKNLMDYMEGKELKISRSWLKNRGKTTKDLEHIGNIMQLR